MRTMLNLPILESLRRGPGETREDDQQDAGRIEEKHKGRKDEAGQGEREEFDQGPWMIARLGKVNL